MDFTVAFFVVVTMLCYALPAFIAVKARLLTRDHIGVLARILMYICSPMLSAYQLMHISFSWELLREMAIILLFMVILTVSVICTAYLILRKKCDDAKYRIYSIATCMGNYSFMGVPVLSALLPNYPEATVFSAMASLVLNIVGWTLASSIITRDKRYISPKKAFLNPQMIGIVAVLPLFLFGIELPSFLSETIEVLGKMSTPLCMIILGMRLAVTPMRKIFLQGGAYLVILVKQMLIPLIVLVILSLLPISQNTVLTIFVLLCCPVASVVLSFSELLGQGQEDAAGLMLLSTLCSTLTMPIMVYLQQFIRI